MLKFEAVEPSELAQIEGGVFFLLFIGAAVAGAAYHDWKYGENVPTGPSGPSAGETAAVVGALKQGGIIK